ncbi:PREDICTED: linker for activation of T-cells family member 2 isoform X3 [Propithecus coquereli]|uniref:linker for activation of T-cells family member 2 isoform X3 n=1 Tax=Propithecus coquereli TaxID=379532 RepID=UPI00063F2E17|nr:PREDICTED: linker for activation of T-cells family member 2 isoform X3 [Propithecus coquereli]
MAQLRPWGMVLAAAGLQLGALCEGWAQWGASREWGNQGDCESEAWRGSSSWLRPWSVPPLLFLVPLLPSLLPLCPLAVGGQDLAQRSPCVPRQESRQSFVVAQTYSLVGHPWPGPLADTVSDVAHTRNEKLLQFSPGLEELACPRYQNFSKGSRHGSDAGYIDPTAGRYYNGERFPKPSEGPTRTRALPPLPGRRR